MLIAGAACEMHPVALGKGIELRSTVEALGRGGTRAQEAGIQTVPAIQIGDRTYEGAGGDGAGRGDAMKANRLYHLIVSREGREPAFLSDPNRTDRIEVVSVDDGEVILYWTVSPKQASKLLKLLRADLASLDAEEFFDKWLDADAEEF